MLENYLMLPRANVLYFDGNVFKEVANDLIFANGINVSPDGSRLYVAETTPHTIQTFNRDLFSGKLTPDVTFTLPAGPDNIDVDEKGDLWVAALTLPISAMRPTSLRPRSTSITCSARSFGSASNSRSSSSSSSGVAPRGRVPAIGRTVTSSAACRPPGAPESPEMRPPPGNRRNR